METFKEEEIYTVVTLKETASVEEEEERVDSILHRNGTSFNSVSLFSKENGSYIFKMRSKYLTSLTNVKMAHVRYHQ